MTKAKGKILTLSREDLDSAGLGVVGTTMVATSLIAADRAPDAKAALSQNEAMAVGAGLILCGVLTACTLRHFHRAHLKMAPLIAGAGLSALGLAFCHAVTNDKTVPNRAALPDSHSVILFEGDCQALAVSMDTPSGVLSAIPVKDDNSAACHYRIVHHSAFADKPKGAAQMFRLAGRCEDVSASRNHTQDNGETYSAVTHFRLPAGCVLAETDEARVTAKKPALEQIGEMIKNGQASPTPFT